MSRLTGMFPINGQTGIPATLSSASTLSTTAADDSSDDTRIKAGKGIAVYSSNGDPSDGYSGVVTVANTGVIGIKAGDGIRFNGGSSCSDANHSDYKRGYITIKAVYAR